MERTLAVVERGESGFEVQSGGFGVGVKVAAWRREEGGMDGGYGGGRGIVVGRSVARE